MADDQGLQRTLADPYIQFPIYQPHTTDDQRRAASATTTFDELPLVVPSYPTCPYKEVIGEDQVEEWVARRAFEFAFTRHGERRAVKRELATTITPAAEPQDLDPTLDPAPSSIDAYQTLHSALAARVPPSPTMQEIESLGAAVASHDQTDGAGVHGSPTPSSSASTGGLKRRRGTAQYESIVEYRCCWSGSYRPRAYENKTGQKRQRAPSTKVGCKAKFVIRKVAKTGQVNVTYYWQHNGHDPTNIEQIKRMRSAQLPDAIKTYLNERQSAEVKRLKDGRVLAAGVDRTDKQGETSARVTTGKRKHGGGDLAQPPGIGSSSPLSGTRTSIMVDPRLTEISMDGQRTTSSTHQPSGIALPPPPVPPLVEGDVTWADVRRSQTHDQHQQMLALIPAPRGVQEGEWMGNHHQHAQGQGQPLSDLRTSTGTQERAMMAQEQGHEWDPSLSLPSTTTTTTHVTEGNTTMQSNRTSPVSAEVSTAAPPPLLPLLLGEFREGLNAMLLRVHAAVEELEQLPLPLPGCTSTNHDDDGEDDGGAGPGGVRVEEVREALMYGEEAVRRVEAVTRALGTARGRA